MNKISHLSAVSARGIENIIIHGKNSESALTFMGCETLARIVSVTLFPTILTGELILKRIPKLIFAIGSQKKICKRADKVAKYALSILFTPLALWSPDFISVFYCKEFDAKKLRPYGVEEIFGKKVDVIYYPKTVVEVQSLILKAKKEEKKVSVIGAGMSQGKQTVPENNSHLVINTKLLNSIVFNDNENTVTAESGATWEQIQIEANKRGKSAIVKQASDIFTVGGSIGVNCHGWAHKYGAISSTVEELKIIDADGQLKTLRLEDELFGCMFGTLGYFGIIVSAKIKITENEHLVEETEVIPVDDFMVKYEEIKKEEIPLFGGRLSLDQLEQTPFRKVCMVKYKKDSKANPSNDKVITNKFRTEKKTGERVERVALQILGSLTSFTVRYLISFFWKRERKKMLSVKNITRNEALHPPINAFMYLHNSNLHAQWLQEYFIKKENLPNFLRYLGAELKLNGVRVINATIRPTPMDSVSILPYAEQDRYAVVICFDQKKTIDAVEKTKKWIEEVNKYVINAGDVYYQAYMPYATQEQFERCYGINRVDKLRFLKNKYDPENLFGNGHTAKYFDKVKKENKL